MIALVRSLLEMIRFSHTLFALPFALMSATLAWTVVPFRWLDLLGILLCMVAARSAAMSFNRLVDRRIDAANPRTAGRHLPAGKLSVLSVWLFFAGCCLAFVGATFLFTWREPGNWWPVYLSGPVLVVLMVYSLTKRFTSLAHVWLGLSLMLAPVSAWIALAEFQQFIVPLLIGVAVLFWVAGFDVIYACQDAEFDKQAKLHSIPARLGVANALRLAAVFHVVMLIALGALYVATPQLGYLFLGGVIAIALLLAYEHWLVRPNDLSRVNRAFFQVNVVISIGLFCLVLVQVLFL